jgi:hypothetical protein
MVVEGANDARLAVECDGDKYHGAERWADDMQRQRVLERAGWVFWRCFASAFVLRRKDMLDDLLMSLAARGIEPIGAEGSPISVHTEHRVISASVLPKVRQEPLFETLGGPGPEAPFSGNEAAPQLPNLCKAAPQPTARQPTQPNRAG